MMNMQEMLGESGRTISNMDLQQLKSMLSPPPQMSTRPSIPNIPMSDNEPRMEDRDQVFSIEARIQNLLKSYQMFIDDQDFDRAQQVANEINMLDVQKRQAQTQQANLQIQTGYAGSQRPQPIQDDISRILDSISI